MVNTVAVLMSVLGIGFLGTWAATKLKVPHSVFLVALGLGAGIFIRSHSGEATGYVSYLTEHFPEFVLYVLLPPLIFESAYNLDFDRLKQEFLPLAVLSVVALAVSTGLVGFSLHWIFGLELLPSLVFGALISATDPVAVVSLFREVGAPVRLTTLLEGESLLNDGTAIVLFRVLLASAAAKHLGGNLIFQGGIQFFAVTLGGAAVGFVTIGITRSLLQLTSRSASSQLGITVVSAFLSFIAADHFLGASGVISTLVVGLYLGRHARLELNRDALQGMKHIWEFLSLVANILVFLAVGLTVDLSLLVSYSTAIPLTVGITYLARALSIFMTLPAVNALGLAKPIHFTYQIVLFWGGLRGGLALGLVLLLPDWFPHKQLFLALAIAVVLSTVLVNALTTAKVLSVLGLDQLDPLEERYYKSTLEMAQISAFVPLVAAAASGSLSSSLVESHRNRAVRDLLSGGLAEEDKKPDSLPYAFDVSALLLNERRAYDLRLEDGLLSRDAYQDLSRIVTARFEAFSRIGIDGLENYRFELGSLQKRGMMDGLFQKFASHNIRRMLHRLKIRLEVLLHLKFSLVEASLRPHPVPVAALVTNWLKTVEEEIQSFYRAYPYYASAVQSSFIADTIHARSRKVIEQLFDSAIISGAVRARAERQVALIHIQGVADARSLMRPTRAYLIGRIGPFQELPKVLIKSIAELCKLRLLEPGETLTCGGESSKSLFLVGAGLLEVSDPVRSLEKIRPRLFTGDYFGGHSLVLDRAPVTTVKALMTTELFELDKKGFELLLDGYPSLKRGVLESLISG